jgi:nicotinamidase/pyrazinamidase
MKRALIIVDMQRDFLPGGALGVLGGDDVIPIIEGMALSLAYDLVVTTADWHPENTAHFARWPVHCVQGTPGAEVVKNLASLADVHIQKGTGAEDDGYSAFEGTAVDRGQPLREILRYNRITSVDVVGLALDYCVKATALDAVGEFDVRVPLAATAPVDPVTGASAIEALRVKGVEVG